MKVRFQRKTQSYSEYRIIDGRECVGRVQVYFTGRMVARRCDKIGKRAAIFMVRDFIDGQVKRAIGYLHSAA